MTDTPTTGAPVPATAPEATQPDERSCPVCGAANPAAASFCEACGNDLGAAAATLPPSGLPQASALPQAAAPAGMPLGGSAPDGSAEQAGAAPVAGGATQPAGVTQADGVAQASPASPGGAPSHAGGVLQPDGVLAAATPQTAPAGEESPLDVGWTGPVPSAAVQAVAEADDPLCQACGRGHIVDGYCDQCGTPPPDPRFHVTDAPSTWVGGVCDIGKRHTRNEDAMALRAAEPAGSRAVLVVLDGDSMSTDSHIASLATAHAARAVL